MGYGKSIHEYKIVNEQCFNLFILANLYLSLRATLSAAIPTDI